MGIESFFVRLCINCENQVVISNLKKVIKVEPYHEYKNARFMRRKGVIENQFIIKDYIKADINEDHSICLEACLCNFEQYMNDMYAIYKILSKTYNVSIIIGNLIYQELSLFDFKKIISEFYSKKYVAFLNLYGIDTWNSLPGESFFKMNK